MLNVPDEMCKDLCENAGPKMQRLLFPDSHDAVEDAINHPSHYKVGGIETLDFIRAKLTPEEYKGYLKGNVLKYLSRAPFKGKEVEDYGKSSFYMSELMKGLQDAVDAG